MTAQPPNSKINQLKRTRIARSTERSNTLLPETEQNRTFTLGQAKFRGTRKLYGCSNHVPIACNWLVIPLVDGINQYFSSIRPSLKRTKYGVMPSSR